MIIVTGELPMGSLPKNADDIMDVRVLLTAIYPLYDGPNMTLLNKVSLIYEQSDGKKCHHFCE